MNYIEKYIDLTDCDAEQQINSYIANGWHIHDMGLTLVILRENVFVEIAE